LHKFQDEQLISVRCEINNQFAEVLSFKQPDESVGRVFLSVNNIFAVPDAPFGKPVSCLIADMLITTLEKLTDNPAYCRVKKKVAPSP